MRNVRMCQQKKGREWVRGVEEGKATHVPHITGTGATRDSRFWYWGDPSGLRAMNIRACTVNSFSLLLLATSAAEGPGVLDRGASFRFSSRLVQAGQVGGRGYRGEGVQGVQGGGGHDGDSG